MVVRARLPDRISTAVSCRGAPDFAMQAYTFLLKDLAER
jgi:hypothetical protein